MIELKKTNIVLKIFAGVCFILKLFCARSLYPRQTNISFSSHCKIWNLFLQVLHDDDDER